MEQHSAGPRSDLNSTAQNSAMNNHALPNIGGIDLEAVVLPTPAQIDKVQPYIGRIRLAQQRGENAAALNLIGEAQTICPGNKDLILMKAESLVKAGSKDLAKQWLQRGKELYPEDKAYENAFGELILKMSGFDMSIGLMDEYLAYTDKKQAVNTNLIFPGIGFLLMKKTVLGMVFIALTICSFAIPFFAGPSFLELFSLGGLIPPGPRIVIPPIIVSILCQIVFALSFGNSDVSFKSIPVDRPTPPVDKPFE